MEEINERNWNLLLEAINNSSVVPILGNEIFHINSNGKNVLYEEYIIQELAKKFDVPYEADIGNSSISIGYSSINDKIEDLNFQSLRFRKTGDITDIYYEINSIFRNIQFSELSLLKKILSIDKFPLILTTSYNPVIEDILFENSENSKVYSYNRSMKSDIPNNISVESPTLYYLFGRLSKMKNSFMVTEDDLLDYLHCWHNDDTRPKNLVKYLENKYLLIIGCDYPNWLFRFLWYSIRSFSLSSTNYETQGLVANNALKRDHELSKFLSRVQTHVYEDSTLFIDKLLERWNAFKKENTDVDKNNSLDEDAKSDYCENIKIDINKSIDIFISYAHEDYAIASKLEELLVENGANVWLDKRALSPSEDYRAEIKTIIQKAKRFMPVLSNKTTIEESRFFRREWTWALSELECRLSIPYISPVVIDSVDINDPLIPEQFRNVHIIDYNNENLELDIKKLIRSIRK